MSPRPRWTQTGFRSLGTFRAFLDDEVRLVGVQAYGSGSGLPGEHAALADAGRAEYRPLTAADLDLAVGDTVRFKEPR